jgi:hypothetical protein
LFDHLKSKNVEIKYKHSVKDIKRASDGSWKVKVPESILVAAIGSFNVRPSIISGIHSFSFSGSSENSFKKQKRRD